MRLLLLFLLAIPVWAGTFTAADCNQSSVNAIINGPTHTAANGDEIVIPAGSCSWTSSIAVAVLIYIHGTGTPDNSPSTKDASASCKTGTVITDNVGTYMLQLNPTVGTGTLRISCLQITAGAGQFLAPINFNGSCNSSGCPNVRMDNVYWPVAWETRGGGNLPDGSVTIDNGIFGVFDHNTVDDVNNTGATSGGFVLANVGHPSWKGVGAFGDNSWADATTFGTSQELYIENNTFNHGSACTDTDAAGTGGGRFVCRFNSFPNVSPNGAIFVHGTETTGRPRGGRQVEAYGNTMSCNNASGCTGPIGMRSGVYRIFGNSFSVAGGFYGAFATFNDDRRYRNLVWGFCGGGMPWDTMDGQTVSGPWTVSTATSNTVTVGGTPWTVNQFQYTTNGTVLSYVYDISRGEVSAILSNTANQLTVSGKLSGLFGSTFGGVGAAGSYTAGDSIEIIRVTQYAGGSHNGASGTTVLSVAGTPWTTNQWQDLTNPYSILDLNNAGVFEIASNTSNTLGAVSGPTLEGGGFPGWTFSTGDNFAIVRATFCLDQPAASGGSLLSGGVPQPPTSSSTAYTSQTIDPTYEWADVGGNSGGGPVPIKDQDSNALIANRNFYMAVSPFTGASGTGFGPKAARPATCTTGTAYWATDEGNWNTSGINFPGATYRSGNLYVCTGNAWPSSPSYTPYTYPHPLITGGSPPPAAPVRHRVVLAGTEPGLRYHESTGGAASPAAVRGVPRATTF